MKRTLTIPTLLLFLAASFLAIGCSSSPKKSAGSQALSGTDEQIFIGDTVEKNYDPNVIMKRAEAFFEKGDYPEAIIEYQHFLDLHRIHTLAPYAQFKLGESNFKIAKTIDRDSEPVQKALEAFEKLRKDYPASRYDAEAVEKIRAAHDWLAQVHFFIGQFYFRREAYLAAAHRFEAILKEYPDMEVAPDAMYYLALSYHEFGADDWAQEKLIMLAQRYPGNKHQSEGQRLLAKLQSEQKTTAVALAGVSANGVSSTKKGVAANSLPSMNGSSPQVAAQTAPTPVASLTPVNRALPTPPKTSTATPNALAPQATPCRLGAWCGDSSNGVSAAQNGAHANALPGSNGSSSQAAVQPIPASGTASTPVSAPLPASPKVVPSSPSTLTPQATLCRLGAWC